MSEVPLLPLWVTVVLTIWAPVGPLVGIVIGHFLVRSWERRRWLADNRKDEYRQVLTALHKLNGLMIEIHSTGVTNLQALKEVMDETTIATNTCLFINEFLEKSKVLDDILAAVRKLNNGGAFEDYHEEYWKAINLILADANKTTL